MQNGMQQQYLPQKTGRQTQNVRWTPRIWSEKWELYKV